MRRLIRLAALAAVLAATSTVAAQTSLKGAALAFQSDNTPDGRLDRNGYVGTFVHVEKETDVTLIVRAIGTANAKLKLVINNDTLQGDATEKEREFQLKTHLPAGTYFVRVQLDDAPKGERSLSIASLDVEGAAFANENTDANALAAADSYIEHFRKGPATLTLRGVELGSQVQVKLKRHAFNFGAGVSGYETSMHMEPNPVPGSDSEKYQAKLRELFNLIVPGNAGKWAYNEKERGVPTMAYIDRLRDVASANHQKMRMHALLWDTGQQPGFVQDLMTKAAEGDAAAKGDLRKAISERIRYYVKDRTRSYEEIDVLNESFHQPRYLNIFGVEGIADIFKEVADVVRASGATTQLCVNEYNLFQWSQTPPYGQNAKGDFDSYATWYREHVEQLQAAGGPVTAIGIQYYADVRADIPQPHSAARIHQVLQNMSVAGLPISLTEFGANALPKRPETPTPAQQEAAVAKAAEAMDGIMRLSFGTPAVTTFISWGFWEGDVWEQAPLGVLFDKQWNVTPAGSAYLALRKKWDTDITVPVGSDGKVMVEGFFGEYDVTAGDRTGTFTLKPGTGDYTVELKAR